MSERGQALRQGALIVHALPQRDRGWLLGQLAEAEREALEPLLAELEALGIPADPGLLDQAMQPVRPALHADAAAVAAVLAGEPDQLAARVLALRDWPRREALLANGTPQRRGAAAGGAGSRLDRALLDIVARHALAQDGRAAAASPQRGSAPEAGWLRRLGRRWSSVS